MRIYNASIGKFLSVDPLTSQYPWYTPYQFAGNKPINAIDLDGAEELMVYTWHENGKTWQSIVSWEELFPGQEHGPLGGGTAYFDGDITNLPDGTKSKDVAFVGYDKTFMESTWSAAKGIASGSFTLMGTLWDLMLDPGGFVQTGSGNDPSNSTQSKSKRIYGEVDAEKLMEMFELLDVALPDYTFSRRDSQEFEDIAGASLDVASDWADNPDEFENGDSVGQWMHVDGHWQKSIGDSSIWVEPNLSTGGPSNDTVDIFNLRTSTHNYKMSEEQHQKSHERLDQK